MAYLKALKPAVCASFDASLPLVRALPMIKEAGFEVVSLTGDSRHYEYLTPAGRAAIRAAIGKHGIAVDSLHAPFPKADRLFSLYDADREESIRQCRLSLDAAAELDGRIVVVHLIQPYGIPDGTARTQMIERGRGSIGILAEHAGKKGVKLALENGQQRPYDEVLIGLLEEYRDAPVGFCYDSGHENVQGRCFALLEQFGHRLLTVHIHDNEGTDAHLLPYEGNIDWNRFRQVLAATGYAGNIHLESSTWKSRFKDPAEFLAEAMRRVRRIIGE